MPAIGSHIHRQRCCLRAGQRTVVTRTISNAPRTLALDGSATSSRGDVLSVILPPSSPLYSLHPRCSGDFTASST
ncbi:uncharacterized protein SEPMUDRAFT_151528 [Sphaerulina musiva SO2202]|uniref:Uncharacterized protein n=1 Tax=Sphaerulina musiva (strain SO2202) TaxID=692275 RepID=N1QHT6_SPHMS|nr:uncharacterized protein SEPMUDRAFT_151528 [Sphaerulina musiva SO2202]EMF09554.1 hypothetical protein SEPMUDRAFT_151528 [Sphaerulina musiva SO2202]